MATRNRTAANATTAAAAVPSSPTSEPRRAFEVAHGTLRMGPTKAGVLNERTVGDTVYADELEPGMLEYLLGKGDLVDHNKPVAPSQAEKVVAFDHLLDVAKSVGAVKQTGSEFRLAGDDENVHKGLIALRKNVSIDKLKAAIVARFND